MKRLIATCAALAALCTSAAAEQLTYVPGKIISSAAHGKITLIRSGKGETRYRVHGCSDKVKVFKGDFTLKGGAMRVVRFLLPKGHKGCVNIDREPKAGAKGAAIRYRFQVQIQPAE